MEPPSPSNPPSCSKRSNRFETEFVNKVKKRTLAEAGHNAGFCVQDKIVGHCEPGHDSVAWSKTTPLIQGEEG